MNCSVMEGKEFNDEVLSCKELHFNCPLLYNTHKLIYVSVFGLTCEAQELLEVVCLV